MTPAVRLLPFAVADGPTNMARDEAMLLAADDRGTASLRFYGWSEPTLSLGYFQPAAARAATPALAGLPWLRRATGGAAIVHDRELTYALALPAGRPWQRPGESWACRFHGLVRGALAERGVAARGVACGEESPPGSVLCFHHRTPADLTVDGSKVAGSAQRKRRGALLQHGSVLLGRSPFAPDLPGIDDAPGRAPLAPEALAEELATRLAADTGWPVVPSDWTAEEREAAARARAERYAAPAWNGKR